VITQGCHLFFSTLLNNLILIATPPAKVHNEARQCITDQHVSTLHELFPPFLLFFDLRTLVNAYCQTLLIVAPAPGCAGKPTAAAFVARNFGRIGNCSCALPFASAFTPGALAPRKRAYKGRDLLTLLWLDGFIQLQN